MFSLVSSHIVFTIFSLFLPLNSYKIKYLSHVNHKISPKYVRFGHQSTNIVPIFIANKSIATIVAIIVYIWIDPFSSITQMLNVMVYGYTIWLLKHCNILTSQYFYYIYKLIFMGLDFLLAQCNLSSINDVYASKGLQTILWMDFVCRL